MGFTRSSSGLLLRDEFSSDTSANYSGSCTVDSGLLTPGATAVGNVQTSISTAYCVTARMAYTASFTSLLLLGANNSWDGATADGYAVLMGSAYPGASLRRYDNGNNTTLATNGSAPSGAYALVRLYKTAAAILTKCGNSALADLAAASANDTTYSGGFYPGIRAASDSKQAMDWLEARTAHTITCTGMTTGHYLRVSDGTTAAEAQESSGTATVDAGAVLFPLASVQIRTASGGGGDLIAELDTGDYADMGGGDAFAYSAASAAWLPFMKHNVIGLGGLHG